MVATNMAILILGLAIAGIGALAIKQKSSRIMARNVGVIVAIAGGLLFIPAVQDAVGGFIPAEIDLGGAPAAVEPGVPTPGTVCAVEDTTITVSAIDKATTAATGGTHRYKVNGAPAQTVSDAGTFTASPGDVIEILYTNASSTTYFSDVDTVTVPCAGTKTFSKELYSNGTLTIDVFNEEGDLIDGDTAEAITNGDVPTLQAKLKGVFEKGTPYGGIIVVEYNKTTIDDVIVDFGGTEVNVPQVYTITLGTESGTKAYSVPAVIGTDILLGEITIDADDTTDPTVGSNVTVTFLANDYFVNADTGGSFDGPAIEDQDDVETKSNRASLALYVS